ncbi:MAG: hypothetical protein U0667_10525, partial [Chloroflexota bacterium]
MPTSWKSVHGLLNLIATSVLAAAILAVLVAAATESGPRPGAKDPATGGASPAAVDVAAATQPASTDGSTALQPPPPVTLLAAITGAATATNTPATEVVVGPVGPKGDK